MKRLFSLAIVEFYDYISNSLRMSMSLNFYALVGKLKKRGDINEQRFLEIL